MSPLRTRWAAIGAAVAVTLGAGGIGLVSATNPSGAVAFVPITPCRVMDTRTEFNVGPKTSPLGPGEVHTVNTTIADTGNCTDIPTTATAVSLNITALDATLPTFLTVWATGRPQPEASSLNPVPGQPPTPNAVTTAINNGGQFDIYNLQGNVHVIADINGYYTDHHHDDRYYTKAQIDDRATVRSISMPAQSLNENPDSTVITPHFTGLEWTNDYRGSAVLALHRPADWTGTNQVILKVLYRRSTTASGDLRFFARPRDYDAGDEFSDAAAINSATSSTVGTDYREFVFVIPPGELAKDWWEITLQRDSPLAGAYPDPVWVSSVELSYVAADVPLP